MAIKANKILIELTDNDEESASLRFKFDPEVSNPDDVDITQPCVQLLYSILESLEDGLQETERVLN
jgi:hypothetical protein